MTDITKCAGDGCPLNVRRAIALHVAGVEMYQSFVSDTRRSKNGKCEMYWGETAQSIFEQLSDVVGAMNCDECGGFGYHKMSCSSVK
jgi:hypothetical protein